METQAHMDTAHRGGQEARAKEPVKEITEEEFLKELYLFMKKRDTPIERIPNLGFKQIDLFLMFKTVSDFGGYHQVTAQQMWKQVYNMLGGNPRSTSAATCTRRHYEKLLLPYECHVKGILMNILPQNQPNHFFYAKYNKEDGDGQRSAKRKLLSVPLHQNPHNRQSDPHGRGYPLPLHYPHYYHPSHAVLPPHVPISSSVLTPHSPPASKYQFSLHASDLNPTEQEPLERLRFLAEKYKTSSGLAEPLNLTVKASRREANKNPASSFTPPSSSKNPKFLNKPFPLYTPHHPQMVRDDVCETQDGEAGLGDTPYSYPDSKAITASSSPTHDSAPILRTDESATTMAQKPSSPQTDFTIRPIDEREGSPEEKELSLSHSLPSLSQENEGKMEIEIPLSVFHDWLRLYGFSAAMHRVKQLPTLPTLEEQSGQSNCSDTDALPTNLTFHMNLQQQSSAAEDLRLRQRKLPSPTAATQTTSYHHDMSPNPFTSYKPLPSCGILKNAASQDVYPFDQRDINKSHSNKRPHYWDAYDKEIRTPPIQEKTDSSPFIVQQNSSASKSYNEDSTEGGEGKSDTGPSAALMMNSTSLLHFTNEEVMKLKKMISSSS
ncbi:AT-rich interaction domain 6 [Pempheris klunzingeri]|uniref:AT-rich interaction domain 6 n=1 Tax=Pempheris klunzingeri TaxID=3127111 RepID=UPI00398179BA